MQCAWLQRNGSIKIEELIGIAFDIDSKAQVVVGIGGGKVIDGAKYAAYLRKLPFIRRAYFSIQ